MTRPIFFDPAAAIGAAVALALALDRKPRPPALPSEATLARLYDEAKREDWNRAVAARKVAKKSARATNQTTENPA